MKKSLVSFCLATLLAGVAAGAEKRPNIILLLADDLGYGDPSCYGGHAIPTPHLDRLARLGTRYTHFYAASAVCTPARAGILTGRYPIRFGISKHFKDDGTHIAKSATMLSALLRKSGYATWHVGKWHLGGLRTEDLAAHAAGRPDAAPGPLQFGFEHSLATLEGNPRRQLAEEKRFYADSGKFLVRNGQRAPPEVGHWETVKINEAIALMNKKPADGRPFFMYLCFDAPHAPYEPAPEPHYTAARATGATGDQLYFRSMLAHLDAEVGRLVEYLRSSGRLENTLLLFTSDNGAAFEGEVGPFKGGKTDLHEGGLRVPFIAVWPGRVLADVVSLQRGHHVDLLPSICEAAGVALGNLPVDGSSLLPNLTRGVPIERGALFWQIDVYEKLQRHYPKPKPTTTVAVTQGPYKLLLDERHAPVELFQLEDDPRENRNLLGEAPEKARELLGIARRILDEPRANPAKPVDAPSPL